MGYVISCIIMALILAAFIPAMIAAKKGGNFVKWYIFGAFLFPVALVGAICIRKPVKVINVRKVISGEMKKKRYRKYVAKNKKRISVDYVVAVFLAKLIFSAFTGFMLFALSRTFTHDTLQLRITVITFSVVFAFFLSVTEICGFSRIPIIGDEVTKRALMMIAVSIIASLPMFVIKTVVAPYLPVHRDFFGFICTVIAFGIFIILISKMQRRYYGFFAGFFDYCILSVFSYIVYTAFVLVLLSLGSIMRRVASAVAMHLQLFNFSYFENAVYIDKLPSIYIPAIVSAFVVLMILVSGLLCRKYKRKELAYRVEYRTKAFRMTRKRVLRRHIPAMGSMVRPLK